MNVAQILILTRKWERQGSIMPVKRYALFDLDYTLIPQDTLLLFCNYILRRHRLRTLYLLIFAIVSVPAILKLAGSKTVKCFFLSFLAGLRREYIDSAAQDFVRRSVIPRIYPEMRAEIDRHRKEGRITVLNTASPLFYAKYIGEELGFDHVFGTSVVLPDRFPLIGRIEGKNNKRYAKIEQMMDILPSSVQILLRSAPPHRPSRPNYPDAAVLVDSWAYSDSDADLPMLRLTQHAGLVHPEKSSLIHEGRAKGWIVMQPLRPYHSRAGKLYHAVRQVLGLYPD